MESLYVPTADLRMHYLQEGTGDPVIFLHGFPETSYEWRKQFPALAGGHALFAPDTRGFGGTDKPGIRVNRTMLAQDVVNFMDALDIERAAVVAHDWGGIIAFKLAIDWPERVSRLAMLDTLCTVWAPAGAHGYWFKAEPLPEEFFAAHHRGFIESIFTGGSEPPLPRRPQSPWPSARPDPGRPTWATAEDVEEYARAFADPSAISTPFPTTATASPSTASSRIPPPPGGERYEPLGERAVAEMWLHPGGMEEHPGFGDALDYGPEDRHKRFEAPVLWMFGQYMAERIGTAGDDREHAIPRGNPFVDQFSRYFPDLRVRRVNAGHFFPEEAPEVTNDTLQAFLAGAI